MKYYWLLWLVFIFVISGVSCNDSGTSDEVELIAGVFKHDKGFTIHNNNDFDWTNMELYLNYKDDDLSSGYIYSNTLTDYNSISARGWKSFATWRFRNAEGRQFNVNPPREEPVKLLIQADTPYGPKTYLVEWTEVNNPSP